MDHPCGICCSEGSRDGSSVGHICCIEGSRNGSSVGHICCIEGSRDGSSLGQIYVVLRAVMMDLLPAPMWY